MNRLAIACAALLAALTLRAAAPKIMVQMTVDAGLGFQDPDGIADSLESHIQYLIRKEFPCAQILTPHDVRKYIGFMRQRALLGVPPDQEAGFEQGMKELAGAVGSDYLVVLRAMALPGRWVLNGKWLNVRKANALAMATEELAPNGDALIDASERIADKLMDEAAYFEICPYTGPVKITLHSTRAKSSRVEYATSCNGMDQQYVKTSNLNRTEDATLDLKRTGRVWATGDVNYVAVELEDLEEQDPCHLCPSGRRGPRIYTEHTRTETKITGFSKESSTAEHDFTDVRVYLKFSHDGRYSLQLAGASKSGTRHVKIDRKAEGNCDTQIEKPHEDYTTHDDVPLTQIMGPFQGTPRDKTLTGREEFRTRDPATDEETTINVEFQLRRD